MKRKHVVLLVILTILLVFSITGCKSYHNPYNEEDFIGRTAAEIVDKFGEYDHIHSDADEDGVIRNNAIGYKIGGGTFGEFGTYPPIYFLAYIDENGICYKCEIVEGGWGG